MKKPLHLLRIFLARQYVKFYPGSMFVGVTGSVGKTTTVSACLAVLSQKFNTVATKPGLEPSLSVLSAILRIVPATKKVVLEMGVEHKGEMDFYLSLINPRTAIVSKIYFAHNESLGDIDEIVEEKGKLIEQLPSDGVAILNFDDFYSQKLSEKCRGSVIYFGTDPKNCLVWAGNIRIENLKTIFELNYGVERIQVDYNLLGEHQVYPALAAATLGIISKIPLTKIKIALEGVKGDSDGLAPVSGPNGSIILNDTYDCSPASVEAAIDTLVRLSARRRIIVLGEMRELGKYSEKLHRAVAQKIFKEKIDLVLLGQGETHFIAEELKSLGFWEDRIELDLQNSQIVTRLLKVLGKGDVCLIKGAKSIRFDEVVKRIENKN